MSDITVGSTPVKQGSDSENPLKPILVSKIGANAPDEEKEG